MKNILITGGAGFIGSSISIKLLEKGYSVTVLDNMSEQIHGAEYSSSFLFNRIKSKVNFIKGDVRSRKDLEKALQDQHAVIHLAAETGTGQSMYQIQKYTEVNINGTAILLDILANEKHSIEKVLIASSRSIYGEGKYKCSLHEYVYPNERREINMSKGDFAVKCPVCGQDIDPVATDEGSLIHPSSIYGISKQVQEQMVMLACNSIGIPSVAFRYQNVYGPGQSLKNPYTGILSIFSTSFLQNKPVNIFEDGTESRDFVFIDDVVNATIIGLEKPETNNQIFNVGSGVPTSVLTVAEKLKSFFNSESKISISGNFRIGDIRHNYADLSHIENKTGFKTKYEFTEGIKLFAEWVNTEEVEQSDSYQDSLQEMKDKGLFK